MNTQTWYGTMLPYNTMCNTKNINKKKLNSFKNCQVKRNIFISLWNLALDSFKWEGLPETCNSRFLETQLITSGFGAIVNNANAGYQSLGAMPMKFNIYGEPSDGTVYGFFGEAKKCKFYLDGGENTGADAVLCRDNISNYPYINYIIDYADRLADLIRAQDTAAWLLQLPYIITCEQSQENTFKALFDKVDEHMPYVTVSNALNPETINALNLNPQPMVLEALWTQYKNMEGEIKTLLGITNNPAKDKKERLITDEIASSNEITNDYLYLRLKEREIFAERCNRYFGLNIKVTVNESREFQLNVGKEKEKEEDETDTV